jgi:hypothetical protein
MMFTHSHYFTFNKGEIDVGDYTGSQKELAGNEKTTIMINVRCNGNCREIFM